MFTGIISEMGTVERVEHRGDLRVRIRSGFDPESIGNIVPGRWEGNFTSILDRAESGIRFT